ncbi:C40 family peptidase [Micromonospora chalcea]|uniref:Peptidoglycan endopeptidase n=1 Tax=Micromonospora aurantiaca (nom. illeg.) TaxID=47850 RepID=A0A1C6TMX9_9ACTN|nr:NLP/P60 protein [Micromonospora sp. L5]AXH94704.1 peptidoglycan endopeptidase [Micromonospora aurantiaca]RBJ11045.1 peptidoglycan endopeptidase [Micromonospora provocatoris]KAB1118663.1 peptidoglycan endopeptidase [Micromonospora aurantiaca]RNH97474.1 peptidoglycan endopeptidase [Micromonospora aurantiaca]
MASLPLRRPPASHPPVRRGGLARRALVLLAAAALGAGLLAAPVHAAPSADEIEAQIDKQWEQLEPTIEGFNKVRAQLKVNQKKAADLEKKMAPLELESALAMNRVGAIAARYYVRGPSQELGALLVSTKPGTLAEQLVILDRLAAQQHQEIAGVLAVRDRYQAQKKKLDELIAAEVKQQDELAAKKKQIDAEIKRLTASLPKTTVKVTGCPTISGVVSSAAQTAIRVACQQVGDPYVWGADGPDAFDCSGLTQYAYKAAGISLTHFTGAQWNEGRPVSRADARPGDLIFFFSDLHHMGLYLGNGLMVHAPRAGKPVNVLSITYMPVAGFRRVT